MVRAHVIHGWMVGLGLLAPTLSRAEVVPAAIGRISYGAALEPGAAICTGVLVAPDLVLTAAHCVRDAADTPETIHFDAGWSEGGASGQRQGAEVILSGEAGEAGLAGLVADVALVVLATALPPDEFPPLPLGEPGDGPFTLIGFARSAPDQPQNRIQCGPLAKPPGLLGLDCPVVSGNSGAPLLQHDGDGWRVVAIMVASAKGEPVRSWAVLPSAAQQLRIAAAGRKAKD